jgi:hypothetical protein
MRAGSVLFTGVFSGPRTWHIVGAQKYLLNKRIFLHLIKRDINSTHI